MEPEKEYEIWGGEGFSELQASTDNYENARHYYAIYAQDGPVQLQMITKYREYLDETP